MPLPHHASWLVAHPDRDAAWLVAVLADGFDIHHLDGNHANDDPANLVLIESEDHARLHGSDGLRRRPRKELQRVGIDKARAEGKYKGRAADNERNAGIAGMLKMGVSWTSIQETACCGRATIAKVARQSM